MEHALYRDIKPNITIATLSAKDTGGKEINNCKFSIEKDDLVDAFKIEDKKLIINNHVPLSVDKLDMPTDPVEKSVKIKAKIEESKDEKTETLTFKVYKDKGKAKEKVNQ